MMQATRWTLLLALLTWTATLSAAPYIVLFKGSPAPAAAPAAHKKNMEDRQQRNRDNINRFFQATGFNKEALPYQDLWLVAGMVIDIKPEDVPLVERTDIVQKVFPDRFRQFIKPQLSFRAAPDKDWALKRLRLPELRSSYPEASGKGVRVGIIDTGIQSRHPEFDKKNLVVFKDFVNGIAYPYDDAGHGTHVAGTIAGATTGIAPLVDIYAAKAFNASGSAYDSWLLKAMQWMYDPDGNPETEDFPHLVNNSWGLDLPFTVNDIEEFEPLHRAVQAWADSSIIPLFAAGNSGQAPNGMPGGFPEVISIAAYDVEGKAADFSSLGPNYWKVGNQVVTLFKPDFAAPGVDIYSAWPGNIYEYLSGTSMATPHATGSVALILQRSGRLTVGQLKQILLFSMEPKFDFSFGSGLINPLDALRNLDNPAAVAKVLKGN